MKTIFVIFFLFFTNHILAQDVHFSQFNKTKSLLNPSLISNQKNNYNFHLQRRSQWSSITVPFNTLSCSFVAKNLYKNISLATTFLNDLSGDSHFSTNGINISIANSFDKNKNDFSAACLIGLYQRSIDFGGLFFLQEEYVANRSFVFFDVGIGMSNHRKIDSNSSFMVGVSLYHLNKPNQSFTEYRNAYLQPKYVLHSEYKNRVNTKTTIIPVVYFSSQKKQKELIAGGGFSYKKNKIVDLQSGIYSRINDAVFFSFGVKKENLEVSVSYDINTSSLSKASNKMGGFEFSINYGWSVIQEEKKPEQNICPKYL